MPLECTNVLWSDLEQGAALYDPQQHSSQILLGQDLGVSCLSYAAFTLWFLGYSDQALKKVYEALTLAQKLSHPFSLAYALYYTAGIHQFRREWQAAQERAETSITLSIEQGFALYSAAGTILWGWVLAEQGQGGEGIAQIRQGLAGCRATGEEMAQPFGLALLAEAYGKTGQAEEGLSVLAEALAIVDKTGERFYEAELYRLKGELVLQSGVRNSQHSTPNT